MITDEEASKIAKLANLGVTKTELRGYAKELSSILDYVKRLQQIDVSNVGPMSHVHGSANVFRDDVVKPSLPVADALKNAPSTSGSFIVVPIIVQGDEVIIAESEEPESEPHLGE